MGERALLRIVAAMAVLSAGSVGHAAFTLDPDFATDGLYRAERGTFATLALDPAGAIHTAGPCMTRIVAGQLCGVVHKLLPEGLLDPSFGTGGRSQVLTTANPEASHNGYLGVRRQPSGKLLYGTWHYTVSDQVTQVVRLNADGTPDPTFALEIVAGLPGGPIPSAVAVRPQLHVFPDGRVLVVTFSSIQRFGPDGGAPEVVVPWDRIGYLTDVAPLPDGGFIAAVSNLLVKFAPDGMLDNGFGMGGEQAIGANGVARAVSIQPDGKLVVAGFVRRTEHGPTILELMLARFHANGAPDTAFGDGGMAVLPSTDPSGAVLPALALAADGRIVVAATDWAGLRKIFLAQVGPDGGFDSATGASLLDPTAGEEASAAVAISPDDGVLVSGWVDLEQVDPPAEGYGAVIRVTRVASSVRLETSRMPYAGRNVLYGFQLGPQGGRPPYSFMHVGGELPSGITFSNGVFSGVPTTVGSYRPIVRISDSLGQQGQFQLIFDVHTPETLVTSYYGSIFGRAADQQGQQFWEQEIARVVGLGASLSNVFEAMAGTFFRSDEYYFRDGARGNAGDAFIADLYATFLGREPDGAGLDYWMQQLGEGLPREALLGNFMFSPEFSQTMSRLFADAPPRAEVSMVMDFFRGLLRRLPDDGGFHYWVGRFRAAQCDGNVVDEVETISSLFVSSGEYLAREQALPPAQRNQAFVSHLYNAFLRRGADLGGFVYWSGQIDTSARTRDNVRREFIASPEFQARVQAVIAQGCMN